MVRTYTKYDINLLDKFCYENNLKLKKDYKNIKLDRNTPIDSFCGTDGCLESFSKTFRTIYEDKSIYCNECTEKNRQKKIKETYLLKLDVKKTIFYTHPELKEEWIGDIEEMKEYTKGSNKKKMWKCKSGNECHKWETTISSRTSNHGCPYCSSPPKRLCECEKCGQSLFYKYPELREEWFGDIEEMKKYSFKSNQIVFWKCKTGNECHIWETSIQHRTGTDDNPGTGCPYCTSTKVCPCEKCGQSLYYTHPELREYWDGDIEEMKKYTKGSEIIKPKWKCIKNNNHKWEALISGITQGSGCPYCNGGTNKVMIEESLYYTNPELRDEWIGDIEEMKKYARCSEAPKLWKCSKFECHIWESDIKDRTVIKKTGRAQGCPYCSSPMKKICDCGKCNSKSVYVTHPYLQKEIVGNPEILKKYSSGSGKELKWKCLEKDCKNEWSTSITSRCTGSGCPSCINKTEKKVVNILINDFEIDRDNIIHGSRKIEFPWCENKLTNRKFIFDILLKIKEDLNIIIEVDGIQHFEYVKHFKNDVEKNIFRDVYKMIKANQNNFNIIRLYQEDVWRDRNDWKEWLKSKIKECTESKECLVFFPNRKEYDKHKEYYEYYINNLNDLEQLILE